MTAGRFRPAVLFDLVAAAQNPGCHTGNALNSKGLGKYKNF
jgi:hypothetical protein